MNLAPIRSLVGERDYVIYIAGTAVALTGQWIQRITIAWLVWEYTQSPLWVGVAAAADIIPTLFAALVGGVLADRWNRPRFIFVAQIASASVTGALALSYYFDALSFPLLLAFRLCLSASVAIAQPARMALIPELVGLSNVTAAISLGAVIFNVARALGPAVAGGLIAAGGFALALSVNSFTYLAMAAAVFVVGKHRRSKPIRSERQSVSREMFGACRYVALHVGYRGLFSLLIVFVLTARAVEDLLPAFVEVAFGGDVRNVAMLVSILGAGSIVGALWSAGRATQGLTVTMLLAAISYGICFAGFATSSSFSIACVLMGLTGFTTVQFGTAAQTLLQVSVDGSMRGRVMSLWFVTMRGGPGLGALAMGSLAEFTGLRTAFLLGACACLMTCMSLWRRRRSLAGTLEIPKGVHECAK